MPLLTRVLNLQSLHTKLTAEQCQLRLMILKRGVRRTGVYISQQDHEPPTFSVIGKKTTTYRKKMLTQRTVFCSTRRRGRSAKHEPLLRIFFSNGFLLCYQFHSAFFFEWLPISLPSSWLYPLRVLTYSRS